MTQYLGDFGVERITGAEEAVNANESTSLLRFGAVHQIVCPVKVVNGKLAPAQNLTEGFGRGAACIPAGSAVFDAYVVVKGVASGAGDLKVGTAKKDGTDVKAADLATADSVTVKGISTGAGAAIDTVVEEDRYIVVSSTATADKFVNADIKVIVEYV
jgi:hypothetical protein